MMKYLNKTEVKLFSSFYVDKLYREVISTHNHEPYRKESFTFDKNFSKGPSGINLRHDFTLNPEKSDFENSKVLYEELKDLNEAQASDERLWTYLTHVRFWGYMRKRWPVEKAENPINRINDRYFLRNLSLRTLTRNGISRLWWYAHLTYDKTKKDPYELLDVLLQRADLVVGITERAIGTNKNIRTALLEFLKENPVIATNEKKTRELIKDLTLCGGVKMLPLFEISEIKSILEVVKPSENVGELLK